MSTAVGATSQAEWYLARDGQQFGPLSDVELRKLVEMGQLKSSDLLWREGFPEWRSARLLLPEAGAGKPVLTPLAATPVGVQQAQQVSVAPATSEPTSASPDATPSSAVACVRSCSNLAAAPTSHRSGTGAGQQSSGCGGLAYANPRPAGSGRRTCSHAVRSSGRRIAAIAACRSCGPTGGAAWRTNGGASPTAVAPARLRSSSACLCKCASATVRRSTIGFADSRAGRRRACERCRSFRTASWTPSSGPATQSGRARCWRRFRR